MNDEHLDRVRDRIGDAILDFSRKVEGQWHMDELRRYVIRNVGVVAPASPDRILRALRQEGLVNYVVVSRRGSLYQWVPLPPQPNLF